MAQRYNRPDREAVLHFLTINIRNRQPIFAYDAYARIALCILRESCDSYPAKLIAYVAMPEHLHCIINPRDGQCTRFLQQYKPAVTAEIDAVAQRHSASGLTTWLQTPEGVQLWQEGKHNLHLWSERLIWQKINYIHNNPVKRRLVRTADAFPYSSFRAFYDGYGGPLIPVDQGFWWDEE